MIPTIRETRKRRCERHDRECDEIHVVTNLCPAGVWLIVCPKCGT